MIPVPEPDALFGPAAPDLGWVPAPRYLLRRHRILRLLGRLPPSRVLEIGSGAGMLLQELDSRGFQCTALETSEQARALIDAISARSSRRLEVCADGREEWKGHFPLVLAFEVLEHIEQDADALARWADWLSPGGQLLLSVPAHPSQWNAADVWAGHYRRYTRDGLLALVAGAGLEVTHFECIGFPLGNLTEWLQARGISKRVQQGEGTGDRTANNDRSGVDRAGVLKWYPFLQSVPGRLAMRTALLLQALTTRLPLGNGYLLQARKPA